MLMLSGTLPEPQPVEKVVRIQDSDFIPQAQTTSYGHDLRSNSFRQPYCFVVENLKLLSAPKTTFACYPLSGT